MHSKHLFNSCDVVSSRVSGGLISLLSQTWCFLKETHLKRLAVTDTTCSWIFFHGPYMGYDLTFLHMSCLELREEKTCPHDPHVGKPLLQITLVKKVLTSKSHQQNISTTTPNLLSNIPPQTMGTAQTATKTHILPIHSTKYSNQKRQRFLSPSKKGGVFNNHVMPPFPNSNPFEA